MTGPLDHSSVAGGGYPQYPQQAGGAVPGQQAMYAPPNYPAGYLPPHMAYMQATGQPSMMAAPYPQQPAGVLPPAGMFQPHHAGGAAVAVTGPTVAPSGSTARPSQSKWDALCRMTDGGESAAKGDFNDSASVAGSMFSGPYASIHVPPVGYSSAMSDYAASERSGPARSVTGQGHGFRRGGRSAWDTLREMTDQESQYAASEV
ncbi:hypothetical protein ACOMHN_033750 [Nucella lapillus]